MNRYLNATDERTLTMYPSERGDFSGVANYRNPKETILWRGQQWLVSTEGIFCPDANHNIPLRCDLLVALVNTAGRPWVIVEDLIAAVAVALTQFANMSFYWLDVLDASGCAKDVNRCAREAAARQAKIEKFFVLERAERHQWTVIKPVYLHITERLDRHERTGRDDRSEYGPRDVAEALGFTLDEVKTATAELLERGWLEYSTGIRFHDGRVKVHPFFNYGPKAPRGPTTRSTTA